PCQGGVLPKSESCDDGLDNDCDGKKDCWDTDCASHSNCVDSDGDGLPDIVDKCPDSDNTQSLYSNIYGCPIPKADGFDIKPDFRSINLSDVRFFEIGKRDFGKISFGGRRLSFIRKTDGKYVRFNLDQHIRIFHNKVEIDSSQLPEMNHPSNITMYNVGFIKPVIRRDGLNCSDCRVISYDNNTLIFSVPHFTTYDIIEGNPTCNNDGVIDPGEQCDSDNIPKTCESLGYSGGMIGCDEKCAFITDECFFESPP
ncbi:unnamed protein product, partial [marine sediment metagenome]